MQRWGISESRLPPGSEIYFREPTAWEQYRVQILAILAVLLVQSGLIGWLIFEHRRRHLAEILIAQCHDRTDLYESPCDSGRIVSLYRS